MSKENISRSSIFRSKMKLEAERMKKDEEFRRIAEKTQIHPLMPTKYNAVKRAELREFERELLTGSKDQSVKPKLDIER